MRHFVGIQFKKKTIQQKRANPIVLGLANKSEAKTLSNQR